MNTPAVVAENYISVGIGKVRLHSGKMFLLAVMAGAFIALAGIGSAASLLSGNSAIRCEADHGLCVSRWIDDGSVGRLGAVYRKLFVGDSAAV